MTKTSPTHVGKARDENRQNARRITRKIDETSAAAKAAAKTAPTSKLNLIEEMLLDKEGATIAEIMATTGWQQHSVRGALAGALKKRGLVVVSEKLDGVRRYRASKSA